MFFRHAAFLFHCYEKYLLTVTNHFGLQLSKICLVDRTVANGRWGDVI